MLFDIFASHILFLKFFQNSFSNFKKHFLINLTPKLFFKSIKIWLPMQKYHNSYNTVICSSKWSHFHNPVLAKVLNSSKPHLTDHIWPTYNELLRSKMLRLTSLLSFGTQVKTQSSIYGFSCIRIYFINGGGYHCTGVHKYLIFKILMGGNCCKHQNASACSFFSFSGEIGW